MKIVKYSCSLNYGYIEYVNVVTDEEWQDLEKAMNENVIIYINGHFGKHSEIELEFEAGDFEIISEEQNDIEFFNKLFKSYVGNINILDRIQDKLLECEEEEDD